MGECVFCDIVRGEEPCRPVLESDLALCFVSADDQVDYHLLVVPKRHAVNILDCDAESLRAVADLTQRVARHLVSDCGFDGVDLLNTSFEDNQSVFHFHVHLLARSRGDGLDTWPKLPGRAISLDAAWRRMR
ncbi:HIT family protein [Bifidobacterium sp. 82T10]|uniref:HIT family protein n=1 Tax=Bifidobacterium miconis TaxID=2834435 RepID=A0ABS6WE98_9BIFI|nr:HIT family protein [Bifidobacterium miconis]MBW3092360.1 HIT family protein [Bifidobacterium miconis]